MRRPTPWLQYRFSFSLYGSPSQPLDAAGVKAAIVSGIEFVRGVVVPLAADDFSFAELADVEGIENGTAFTKLCGVAIGDGVAKCLGHVAAPFVHHSRV